MWVRWHDMDKGAARDCVPLKKKDFWQVSISRKCYLSVDRWLQLPLNEYHTGFDQISGLSWENLRHL